MAQRGAEGQIYQLRITLLDTDPEVWRWVRLLGETDLEELHYVIQVVMGWENSHMHQFATAERRYGLDEDYMPDPESERGTTLREVALRVGDRILYEYDFGDSWEHELLVEEILPPESGVRYPVCTGGDLAAPPEDCGGIPGYYMLLEAIQDPDHPDHEEMFEWVGEDYNPVAFDPDEVNRRLRELG
jgi:hypothetical protein